MTQPARNDEPFALDELPLLLRLSTGGRTQRFPMLPGDQRAVTVGSSLKADLRLSGQIAPVQFHFEREGRSVWLVPTCAAHGLRVNAAPVRGPHKLRPYSVVVVGAIRMEVAIEFRTELMPEWLETTRFEVMQGGEPETEGKKERHVEYVRRLPDEHAETRAIAVLSAPPDILEAQPTTAMAPIAAGAAPESAPVANAGTSPSVAEDPFKGPFNTKRIVPLTVPGTPPPLPQEPVAQLEVAQPPMFVNDPGPRITPTPTISVRAARVTADLRDDVAPKTVRVTPALGRRSVLRWGHSGTFRCRPRPTALSRAKKSHVPAKERRMSRVNAPSSPTLIMRLLTRLGTATLRHPVLVGGMAITVAFAFGASVAVVCRLA